MCGRFTVTVEGGELIEEFDLRELPGDWRPRYNVAPGQDVLVLGRREDGGLAPGFFRWGLVPSWAKDPAIGNRMVNARAETAASKPAFRAAFRQRRCLIPADGFYEWQQVGAAKQPMRIRLRSGRPFAFAGLWESWRGDDGEPVYTCTVLTTEANAALRPIHPRMPVILAPADRAAWLDPGADPETLQSLLRPYPDEEVEAYPVSTRVNNVRNDDAACIEPAEPAGGAEPLSLFPGG